MKKSIIIFSLVLLALTVTAYGLINWNDSVTDQDEMAVSEDVSSNTVAKAKIKKRIFSDFIYDVGPRFNPIKKADLDGAKSFSHFIGNEHAQRIVSYKSLSVIILDGDKKTDVRETSNNGNLTAAQIELLQSSPYSTNILIWADYSEKNQETGVVEDSHWTPHLTIVPEKQAVFVDGKEALMDYLKEYSKDVRAKVEADKLQPAKLFFTVTKEGTIKNVKLDRTSNYPDVDKKMIELISKVPGTWEPAENAKGERVDQELVVSFGLMGC